MHAEALEAARHAEQLGGPRDARRRAFLAYAYARAGQRDMAIAILNELLERSRHAYVPPSSIAVMYVGLADRKSALTWLHRAYDGHDADMVLLKVWPVWSSLRSEPEYRALVRAMGLDQ
jgi:Flp pilus assembly protein TadD